MKNIINLLLSTAVTCGVYADVNSIIQSDILTNVVFGYVWVTAILSCIAIFITEKTKPLRFTNIYAVSLECWLIFIIPNGSEYVMPMSIMILADIIAILKATHDRLTPCKD